MPTVNKWMTDYFELLAIDRAERTLEQYRTITRLYIAPAIGQCELSAVTPMQIDALTGRIKAKGHERTAQQVFALLRAAYRRAIRYDIVQANPCDRAEPVRHKAAVTRYWTADQAAAFLAATVASPYHAAWVLMLCCGLRRGELLGLRWSDIDFDRNTLEISRQRIRTCGKIIETKPKSDSSRATIALDASVAARIAPTARFRRARAYLYPDDTPESLRRALRRDITQTGLPMITLHGLRHTMGAIATSDGVSMRVLQEVMRHADFGVTARTYAHVANADKQRAISHIAHLTLNQGVPGSSP